MLLLAFGFVLGLFCSHAAEVGEYDPRYGTYVGRFKTLHHDVSGEVYAIDRTSFYVRNFNYDGEAPDAYFFAGNKSPTPSHIGFKIPNERGKYDPLGPYRNKNAVIKFPVTRKGQRSFDDIKWISIWCAKFAIDFGYVQIPPGLKVPEPESVGPLTTGDGSIQASNVIMEDSDTIKIKDFSYDGSSSDAIFVMGGSDKNSEGHQIPNEKGSMSPLGRYKKKNLSLKIPKNKKGIHFQYFGIWSPTKGMITRVSFPQNMKVPPSLK